LPGELTTMARVRGVMAAAMAAGSGTKPSSALVARLTDTPPASWICAG
jgi:hypothetical protein